ncbi:MAG: pirin family protein [Crocinitomicaceae bacterium]|nr:pirin family protein [Crocinitomicaceae bacterium]
METHPVKKIRALGFQWQTADPFLFCVHHEDKYPKGNDTMGPDTSLDGRHLGQDFILKDGWRMYHGSRIPGFPGHPHRGFETITVVRKGIIDHADSTGAAGRYGNGDVQWMTAGKGVQHSEMFPLISKDNENPMELFQIWLNLPKKDKMVEPHFKMLWSETIPILKIQDDNEHTTTIEIIAGHLGETYAETPPPDSWASDESNAVGIYTIKLEPNASYELEATEEGVNRTIYYYAGNQLKIQGVEIPNYHAAEVDPMAKLKFTNGSEVSKLLVLQGKPISEPVVQHGPFVMNTREEIQEAFEDYHETQFGGWPWPKYDLVHAREKGRFALYPMERKK